MKKIVAAVFICLLFVSCQKPWYEQVNKFTTIVEKETGHDHQVVKYGTAHSNYIVLQDNVTGEFTAYNLSNYDFKKTQTLASMNLVEGTDIVRNLEKTQEWVVSGYWDDHYETKSSTTYPYNESCDCYETVTVTWEELVWSEWIDTTGWQDFYVGGGFKFDNTVSSSKDLETLAANQEATLEKTISTKLSSEFSLSSQRATELAKLSMRYNKLENSRELTVDEKNKFAMDALGVNFSKVEHAIKTKAQGDEDNYQKLLKAFEYAIERKVDVIHLSVGWPKSYMTVDLEEMIKRAQKMDIVIVAAAGNSSQRATIYPCQMEGVICVGALRANGDIARFSNWGSQVDIYAPGEKILSTIPYQVTPLHLSRKGYDYKNGTSQAAPFVTASVALLKSVYPQEKSDEIYSRLMLGADHLESGRGVRGLFHLEKSLQLKASSYITPKLKGLHSVLIENNKFEISLIIKNHWLSKNVATAISMQCLDVDFDESKKIIETLEEKAEIEVTFDGTLVKNHDDLSCQIKIDEVATFFTLKVHHPFEASEKKIFSQEKPYMVMTKTGARSRFLTINPIPGKISQAFYYLPGLENLPIYEQGRLLGNIDFEKNCQFLRIWQVDLNRDEKIDFMTESLCDKSFLKYQFYGQDLQKLFSDVHYKPALTIINYDNFEMITFRDKAPSFKFINSGLSTPDPSPWANNTVSRKAHLYELQARLVDKEWRYEVSVLEQPKKWMQTLGLRVEPSYQVLHVMQDQLLIMIEKKTALVNLKTQSAQWAGLDHILWMGSQKQPVVGTDEIIFQSFLTQYEYRGFLLNGTKLRFSQNDHFDPLIDILGTLKNANGYLTTLRSFQSLWYVQYNFVGEMISLKKAAVDRFDFLTAQDLISSIINLKHNGEMIQVVDGTKLNTNFIDIIKNGVKKSYRVPERCATQSPVLDEGELKMVLFCAKTVKEFEINFIKL